MVESRPWAKLHCLIHYHCGRDGISWLPSFFVSVGLPLFSQASETQTFTNPLENNSPFHEHENPYGWRGSNGGGGRGASDGHFMTS